MKNFITVENLKAARDFLTKQALQGKAAIVETATAVAPVAVSAKNAIVEGVGSVGTQVLKGTDVVAKSTKKLVQNIAEATEPPCLSYEFDRLAVLRGLETLDYTPKHEDVVFDKIVFVSPFDKTKQGFIDGFLYSYNESLEEFQARDHMAKIIGYTDKGYAEFFIVEVDGQRERPKFTHVDTNGKIKITNNSKDIFYITFSKSFGSSTKNIDDLVEADVVWFDGPKFVVKVSA